MRYLLYVLLFVSPSCYERPTRVVLEGGNPPTFTLRGSGELDSFYLEEAHAQEQPNPTPGVLWKIVPQNSGPSGWEGKPVEDIGKVTYGIVPPDYKQSIPSNSKMPPSLVEGRYYYFHISTVNAPHAWGYIVIKNSRAEFAKITGYCIRDEGGKKVTVPCGESEY